MDCFSDMAIIQSCKQVFGMDFVNVRFYVVTALKLEQFVGPPHEAAVC